MAKKTWIKHNEMNLIVHTQNLNPPISLRNNFVDNLNFGLADYRAEIGKM